MNEKTQRVSRKQRHDWRPGIIQHCGNLGCRWRRTNRSDSRGEPTQKFSYAWGQGDYRDYAKVPGCGSRPPMGAR